MKKIIIALCLLVVATTAIHAKNSEAIDNHYFSVAENLSIFNSLFKQLNIHYVDSIPVTDVMQKGINGMLNAIDPYTVYIPTNEEENFNLMTKGEYAGIGTVISKRGKYIMANEVYKDMPADKAGIKNGYVFIKVDDTSLIDVTTQKASELLRGTAGTKLTLTYKTDTLANEQTVDIVREHIYINPIRYYGMLNDSVGYIFLSNFTQNCADEVKKALLDLRSKGMQNLIFDLRNNPGGYLTDAVDICNFFMKKDEVVVTTKGKNGEVLSVYKTDKEPIALNLPMVVLVNEHSASASEIVSGALQDTDRSVIMGERTYGKGLVQSTFPVAFDGQLKVTIAKYYIPSGRCIQAIKYSPDPKQSPSYIPDSLTTQFKTRNGRIVRDGRGITPDIASQNDSIKGLLFHLLEQYKISDFALNYVKENPTAPAMEQFELTNNDFVAFKNMVLQSNFKFNSYSQDIIVKLVEMTKLEECYDANKALIDSLQANLKQQNAPALDSIQTQITQYLTAEIAKHYYYQWGEMYHILKTDKVVKEALTLFADKKRYESILAQPQK
ncbi:MAG: S41 family peptidase [Paludibacteraceae bacterium]|nr:S41 family peptidase [Paludibacteraceae bacterium]